MTLHSLFPASVKIDYHSPWGAHSMMIPTLAWTAGFGGGGHGNFDTWAIGVRDADDMIKDFCNLLKGFYQPDHFIDQYTIYTYADADAPGVPVTGNTIGFEGTEASAHWSKAVQTTFSIRSEAFGQMKIVLLDAPNPASFDKIASFDASPEALALVGELSSTANGWSARDNARPATLTQIAYTLNEKLRREYNMN